MSVETTDTITLIILLAIWPVWLAWEIYLLIRRGQKVRVRTISMVARERGWHLSSLVYLTAGLAVHWWVPAKNFAPAWMGVTFWIIALGLLVQDILLWKHPVETWPKGLKWQRFPALVMLAGALAGYFLFPQTGLVPWALK